MLSEEIRLAGVEWAKLDAAARMLEEGKTAYLAQQVSAQGDMAYNQAERAVKASREWSEYIKNMVRARTAANLAKIDYEFAKNRFAEWNNEQANERAERRNV